MSRVRDLLLPSTFVLAILVLLAVATPARTQPANTTYWAAIAYSTSTGSYGYSYGWLAESNARRVALKNCKARDAKVIVVVGNYYVALAKGDDPSAYGYGYSTSADEARAIALRECRKRTTNCYIAVCVHSWAG
jgi:serine/threonine-protein kinase